jgi:hypothetical protein
MWKGIVKVKPGARLGDIGHAIQTFSENAGFSVVREFCGHGVGARFHEEPQVLHYGRPGTLEELVPGMVFTIEPMITFGNANNYCLMVGRWQSRPQPVGPVGAHVGRDRRRTDVLTRARRRALSMASGLWPQGILGCLDPATLKAVDPACRQVENYWYIRLPRSGRVSCASGSQILSTQMNGWRACGLVKAVQLVRARAWSWNNPAAILAPRCPSAEHVPGRGGRFRQG